MLDPLRPNLAREIRLRLTNPRDLCERLGLLADRSTWVPQAGGLIIRCPWHEDRSPSCSVRLGRDGTVGLKCHACDATGDALSLIAHVFGLDLTREFRDVLRAGAELAGMYGLDFDDPKPAPRLRLVTPLPAPLDERWYPSPAELTALVAATVPVDADPRVSTWLRGRGIAPERVAGFSLARALRPDASALPRFATFQRRSWVETGHRLIVPMWSSEGAFLSVRAGRVIDSGETPKRLPPAGCRAHGLVMANRGGVAMLRGEIAFERVVIVEGEPDYLTDATLPMAGAFCVLGLVNGSWSTEFARRVPTGATVIVRTDHDKAGDKYAEEIFRSLRGRCLVKRAEAT